MKNNVIVLMFFVFFGCANRFHKTNIPNWYLDLPQIDGEIVVVGTGQEEGDALLTGLYQLFFQLNAKTHASSSKAVEQNDVNMFSYTMQTVVSESFGGFMIQGRTKKIWEEINDKPTINHFSETITLLGSYDDQGILLRSAFEEHNDVTIFDKYEMTPPTYDIELLYAELEKSGIYVKKKYDYNGQHFVMITVTPMIIENAQLEKASYRLFKIYEDALKKFDASSPDELDDKSKEEFWNYLEQLHEEKLKSDYGV